MNKEYGSLMEDTDYGELVDFNEVLKLKEIGRCPEKHTTDASGYTNDGRYMNIELKKRNIGINTFSSIFIEAHKACDMLFDYITENKIPLYINFLNDGYVVVFNLSCLKHRPKKVFKKIYSELYEGFELAVRQKLDMKDAWIYKKENNAYKLVHKP